ncbi:MAG TPA: aminoglycoside phosphotransferase family protein [Solirubrobacterales bacterium]|nr:aminoglycoside phosphotransferase family protein [Solirubrobacterales bacterium]
MSGALRASGDEQVREALELALGEVRGEPVALAELSRRHFAYETSFAIDSLDVELASGERLALLVKDVGPAGLSAEAAAAKPADTLNPEREISVYRDLLEPAGLSTPRFYGAAVEPELERRWLFLERIEGEVLTDVGELDAWCEAATWAARLDAGVPSARQPEAASPLLRRDAAWHGRRLDAAIHNSSPPLGERLRERRACLLERFTALPIAFVHGELYPANVLVERGGGKGTRIAPVDWELAGIGPFALDLAALVSGWSGKDRLAMIRAFQGALPTSLGFTLSDVIEATGLCELSLTLQWIGWSPGWVPPQPQRRDWGTDAVRLLDEVGL